MTSNCGASTVSDSRNVDVTGHIARQELHVVQESNISSCILLFEL